MTKAILLAGACALALSAGAARADDYVDMATAKAKAATAHADKWDGPTSGPKVAAGKTIVFVSGDQKNGGILGASEGVKEAAAAAGWKVTVIDGQGSVSGRTAAMNQALTLKPDGIVVGGFDTKEQQVAFDAAGIKGDGTPKAISAGDGSESAFQRIRAKQYQAGTVPEPLNMQGWQLVDELNRAFNKADWSGYVSGIHLVTPDNIAFDGGPKNVFDPDNGYRDQYKKIWGVK